LHCQSNSLRNAGPLPMMKALQTLDDAAGRLANIILSTRSRIRSLGQWGLRSPAQRGDGLPQQDCSAEAGDITDVTEDTHPEEAENTPIAEIQPLIEIQPIFESYCPKSDVTRPTYEEWLVTSKPRQPSFLLFTELPTEIRLMIWRFASTIERIVEIQWANCNRNCSAPRPPPVLHACRESREEALKIFHPYFGLGESASPKPIYINPINDIVFFRLVKIEQSWRWVLSPNAWWQDELRTLRRVAFSWRDMEDPSSTPFHKLPVQLFENLEDLIIVWADGWRQRSFDGRGVNYFEGVSPDVHCRHCVQADETFYNVRLGCSLEREQWWKSQNGWEEPGWKRPILSWRHWCLRMEDDSFFGWKEREDVTSWAPLQYKYL
jgi:hypothetical protein